MRGPSPSATGDLEAQAAGCRRGRASKKCHPQQRGSKRALQSHAQETPPPACSNRLARQARRPVRGHACCAAPVAMCAASVRGDGQGQPQPQPPMSAVGRQGCGRRLRPRGGAPGPASFPPPRLLRLGRPRPMRPTRRHGPTPPGGGALPPPSPPP